jgi:hypothetical protein
MLVSLSPNVLTGGHLAVVPPHAKKKLLGVDLEALLNEVAPRASIAFSASPAAKAKRRRESALGRHLRKYPRWSSKRKVGNEYTAYKQRVFGWALSYGLILCNREYLKELSRKHDIEEHLHRRLTLEEMMSPFPHVWKANGEVCIDQDWLWGELSSVIERRSRLHIGQYAEPGTSKRGSGKRIEHGRMDELPDDVTPKVVEYFDPTYAEKFFRGCVIGGYRSKRGKKFQAADVLQLDGLTHAEIARKLGCSTKTVQRLKREVREIQISARMP